jgi:hypothetical protein
MQHETARAHGREPDADAIAPPIAEILRAGGAGYFEAAGSLAATVYEGQQARASERALCLALRALCQAALGDRAGTRWLARAALRATARPPATLSAGELRDLRWARALAVNASALIGDVVRARRAGQVRFIERDPDSTWLLDAGGERPWQDAPVPVQRAAKFVEAAHRRFVQACLRELTSRKAGRARIAADPRQPCC